VHLLAKLPQVVKKVGRPRHHVRARLEEERAVILKERDEELEGYDSALAHRPLTRDHAVGSSSGCGFEEQGSCTRIQRGVYPYSEGGLFPIAICL